MMQKKKPQFPLIKDFERMDKYQTKKQIKTIPYSNSQSIQEEEEQSSSQINLFGHSKPSFLMTFPKQPRDCQGSEEVKAPTLITNFLSNKSQEQLAIKKEQHPFTYRDESSQFSSKMNSIRSILEDQKHLQINQERVKLMVNQMKLKFLNLIHYSKYNDPILTQEQQEISPLKYHYFTMYIFLSTTLSNILSCIFIPLVQFFDFSYLTIIISQMICGLTILMIFQDLLFQRGPYKMQRGVIKVDYKNSNKKFLDILRLFFLSLTTLIEIDERIKLVSVLLMMLFQFIRQAEYFENIYRSTHHFIVILQLWISIIISFTCLYQVSHQEEDPNLYFCLTLAVSLLTHSSNISIEVTNHNAFLISFYMIICYLCLAYTTMIFYVWMKPEIEIQEEKQKLLKGFVERFREKCQNDGLLKRCYSYLEFRIDEDLNKTKDQLTKKLSPELEDEIDISLRSAMIDKIELLNRFSPQFKQQLMYEIEQVKFNPEDNIIIEHQIEDIGLFYILKGQVKVQFLGSSFGNNKRTVTTLNEGSTFGQYSFITGIPSNISIISSGVTSIMMIKRSDFSQIISNYPQDNEIFCTLKDNAFYNQKLFECYYCKIRGNYIIECRHLQYFPKRINTIEKYLYTAKQQRRQFSRRQKQYFAWRDMNLNQDRARQYAYKQSQEFASDELPEPSQLPYSENQTYQSVSFVSNSLAQKVQSPDQYQSVSNVESLDQLNIEYECSDEQTIHIQEPQTRSIRMNSNKTTLKTAGFPINGESNNIASVGNNISVIEKDDRDILNQLQEAQMNKDKTILFPAVRHRSQSKQKFQYLKDSSQGILLKEDHAYQQYSQQQQLSHSTLKQSIRQPSSRSQTYSNSLSKDVSNNNPSLNSKQNKSQRLSILSSQNRFHEQQGVKKENSSKSLSDQNKQNNNRSFKSATKQSTHNQLSQFQAISTPENQGYFINDLLFNKFETLQEFKIYYPHNNYTQVIDRYIRFLDSNKKNQFKRKKRNHSNPYSIKCFVASKIKRVKKLLQN